MMISKQYLIICVLVTLAMVILFDKVEITWLHYIGGAIVSIALDEIISSFKKPKHNDGPIAQWLKDKHK